MKQELISEFSQYLSVKTSANAIRSMNKRKDKITDITKFMTHRDKVRLAERLYCIMNDILLDDQIPRCKICGNCATFLKYQSGYSNTCSLSCSGKYRVEQEKIKNNGKYRFQTNTFKSKSKETCKNKYGVENAFQLEEFKDKQKQTLIDKYGVDNCSKIDDVKQKKIDTSRERYGTDYPWQTKDVRDKVKNTIHKLYGREYDNISSVPEIKIKRIATFQSRYCVDNPNDVRIVDENIDDENIGRDYYNRICRVVKKKNICEPTESYKFRGFSYDYEWKCLKCNKEFTCNISDPNYLPGHNECFGKSELNRFYINSSKYEYELYEFCKPYFEDVELNVRGVIGNNEIDIYIPSIELGIEFNGLYWHGEISANRDYKYHLNKYNMCKEQGISVINIFEDEWIHKKDIVKSILLSKFGKIENRIYARKCTIVNPEFKQIKQFLTDNHIQGYINSSVVYGLQYNDELVSILTFSKARFNDSYVWEITRFCNKINTTVIGGFSKLLKMFIESHKGTILTYADVRYSEGNLYKQNGFTFVKHAKPNYFYTDDHAKRYSRNRFQKHKLKDILCIYDPNLTEWENMQLNGYDRIWDCGNIVFELNV